MSKTQKLLTNQKSAAKLKKNDSTTKEYLSYILYLAPSNLVSGINVCPAATAGCRTSCLYTAGRGRFSRVQMARKKKTTWFRDKRESFIHNLVREVDNGIKLAEKHGKTAAFRLNGTSDIDWETEIRAYYPFFYEEREDAIFYEYTKRPDLARRRSPIKFTFSRSEANHNVTMGILRDTSTNIAIVFEKMPDLWFGRRVIDGDKHDMRFIDPANVVVGLLPKGDAKKDKSGFVLRNEVVL